MFYESFTLLNLTIAKVTIVNLLRLLSDLKCVLGSDIELFHWSRSSLFTPVTTGVNNEDRETGNLLRQVMHQIFYMLLFLSGNNLENYYYFKQEEQSFLENEATRFQRDELFKHAALQSCRKKLALTVKISSDPDVSLHLNLLESPISKVRCCMQLTLGCRKLILHHNHTSLSFVYKTNKEGNTLNLG